MVGPKIQAFCPGIDMLKGNRSILRIRGAPVHQKLGMILENEVLKKWPPKLIGVLNDFFFQILLIFVIQN